MKIEFEVKGLKVAVEGEIPDAVVQILETLSEAAREELAKIKLNSARSYAPDESQQQ